MIDEVDFQSAGFIALCVAHRIHKLYAFGSVVTNSFNEQSDIDLLVDIDESDPIVKGKLLLNFYNNSAKFFNSRVDIITEDSLKNPYLKKELARTKRLIYPQVHDIEQNDG
jgi:predicted nucleotidyltransferase